MVLLSGGQLVLLHSLLPAIPIFHVSVFKLLMGIEKRLEGFGLEQSRRLLMVS